MPTEWTPPDGKTYKIILYVTKTKGRKFSLNTPDFTIGRRPDNNIVISDPSVSLKHCRILIDEGVFKIVDLKSRNNTFVNGKLARLTELHHNDVIQCGSCRLIFLEDQPEAVPSARKEVPLIPQMGRPEGGSPTLLQAAKGRPGLSLIVLAAVLINVAAGVVFLQRRFKKEDAPSLFSQMADNRRPSPSQGTGEGLDSKLTRSALQGSNQLAAKLVKPKLPEGLAGIFSPEDDAEGGYPPGADAPGSAVEQTVRGRKMHAIDITGWGVVPPSGFSLDEKLRNTWKPASGDPSASRIRITSGPACRPACSGNPVSDAKVTRGIVASRRSYSYQCRQGISYGGRSWRYNEFTIVKLRAETCVTLALLARSADSRRQAMGVFRRMQNSLELLPRRPPKPLLDEKLRGKKIHLLR